MSLERFHEAQLRSRTGYETALAEIRAGGKRSHWIWYIFPQIEGLGRSSMARAYALRDLGEACAYLRDPILRGRYEEIAGAVSEQLSRGISIEDLMGSQIDALKLASSLTFSAPPPNNWREKMLLSRRWRNGCPLCSNKPPSKAIRCAISLLPGSG